MPKETSGECFHTSDIGSNGRMPVGIHNANLDTSTQGNALNTQHQTSNVGNNGHTPVGNARERGFE